ncbi:MAG: tRNA pseudouridine(38-40) synthase TruA, partial [Eubacterium sp.]|nr:tRNA pseudouridine(38-40) synthase TruA [Eubacterium sp.]
YEYRILLTDIDNPLYQRRTHHVYRPLDLEKMKEAAKVLEGTHDFSAFCSAGAQVKSKVRTVYEVSLGQEDLVDWPGRILTIRVQGNGFLYNMVRIIAGSLIEVGMGRRSKEDLEQALETGERTLAGPTAPAKGLTLQKIEYEGE